MYLRVPYYAIYFENNFKKSRKTVHREYQIPIVPFKYNIIHPFMILSILTKN